MKISHTNLEALKAVTVILRKELYRKIEQGSLKEKKSIRISFGIYSTEHLPTHSEEFSEGNPPMGIL